MRSSILMAAIAVAGCTFDGSPTGTGPGVDFADGGSDDGAEADGGQGEGGQDPADPDSGGDEAGDTAAGGDDGPDLDCQPIIAEVLVNATGNDDGQEWARLHNPCPDAIDLEGYALGWGGLDYTYGTRGLSGVIDAGGCLLVGGPDGLPFDLPGDFDPDLQNATSNQADGLALFDVAADAISPDTTPIDAVIYGAANDPAQGLPDSSGNRPIPHVEVAGPEQSLRRVPGGWGIAVDPTPLGCP